MTTRVYPLTKKTAIRVIENQDGYNITCNYTFFDTLGFNLFTVVYKYNGFTHNEYANLYIAKNRTLLSIRKDTLKKAIAFISHHVDYSVESLSNDIYHSLQNQGLYSAARVYHKKIFEKR